MPSQRQARRDKHITQSFFSQASPADAPCTYCSSTCGHAEALPESLYDPDAIKATFVSMAREMGVRDNFEECCTRLEMFFKTGLSDEEKTLIALSSEVKKAEGRAEKDDTEGAQTFELSLGMLQVTQEFDFFLDRYESLEPMMKQRVAAESAALRALRKPRPVQKAQLYVTDMRWGLALLCARVESSLRYAQMFGMEKRFGLLGESYSALVNEDRKFASKVLNEDERRHGFEKDFPLSMRQVFDEPLKLMVKKSRKERRRLEEKVEKEKAEGKHPPLSEGLIRLQKLCAQATRDIQSVRREVKDGEMQVPQSLKHLTYFGTRIAPEIPDDVRQHIWDLEFTYQEAADARFSTIQQRNRVKLAITIWYSSGREVWNHGKTIVHELAEFRKYEYMRTSVLAFCYVAQRLEAKVVEYFSSEVGAPYITSHLKTVLRIPRDKAAVYKMWDDRVIDLQITLPSVNIMLEQLSEMIYPENSTHSKLPSSEEMAKLMEDYSKSFDRYGLPIGYPGK